MKLTPRQERIARLLADGLSYAAVGRQLTSPKHPQGITAGVVRNYARTIADKINESGENVIGLPAQSAIKFWVRLQDRREQRKVG